MRKKMKDQIVGFLMLAVFFILSFLAVGLFRGWRASLSILVLTVVVAAVFIWTIVALVLIFGDRV